MAMDDSRLLQALEAVLQQNRSLWQILCCFDEIALPDAWLVAGAVAQTVWNLSLGRPAELGIKDVDLVYFDATDLSLEAEVAQEQRLCRKFKTCRFSSTSRMRREFTFGIIELSVTRYLLTHRQKRRSTLSRRRRPVSACAGARIGLSATHHLGSMICSR